LKLLVDILKFIMGPCEFPLSAAHWSIA